METNRSTILPKKRYEKDVFVSFVPVRCPLINQMESGIYPNIAEMNSL